MTRVLIAAGVVSCLVFAFFRVIALGRQQGPGYRREREIAWGGMPKRYRVTVPVERNR